MVFFWLRSDVPHVSSSTAQTAGEAVDDGKWPDSDSAIAGLLRRARTDEHEDAECGSGWHVLNDCGALIAFNDFRSGLHKRFC